jgi:uncharacterized protein (TIGR00730 family)
MRARAGEACTDPARRANPKPEPHPKDMDGQGPGGGCNSVGRRYLRRMANTTRLKGDTALRRQINELIARHGGRHNPELVADVIENALKLLTDVPDRGDARVIQTALRELRDAFRLFAPYAHRRKVTVFGSARTQPNEPEYLLAAEFARLMAAADWMIITGAGPGIMQAGHEGAGPENSFGANIRLPWEQSANPVILGDKKLITFKYFFTRKLTFMRHADALVLFPGGFGTLDEGYEALTLMQTGKTKLMPVVLLNPPGSTYWKTWDKHVREHLLRNRLIAPEDLRLYQITDRAEEAVKVITRFYRNYHSMRFVRDLLVVRLQHAPSASALKALNDDFADILARGAIRTSPPLPEEKEETATLALPRLAFAFNRRDYGRLRQLIDVLNSL